MELTQNYLEKGLSGAEKGENTRNTSDDLLGSMGSERVNSLKQSIGELEFLIAERENLSKIIVDEVENIKTNIENFLLKYKASDSDGFKERSGLRQKQIDISELQLNEKVNCWRDVAMLKKELRERQKELSERQERMAMLGEMIG